jgi:hypothetical protein
MAFIVCLLGVRISVETVLLESTVMIPFALAAAVGFKASVDRSGSAGSPRLAVKGAE